MTGIANGYHILPPGRIANAVTWLQREVPPGLARPPGAGRLLRPLRGTDAADYRDIYALVGTDWLWSSRLAMPPHELAAWLGRREVETFAACIEGEMIGLLEMEESDAGVEVVYFGLAPEAVGQGSGRWLMQEALAAASARGARRIWLHTCNYDHPKALGFYLRCGFAIYAQGFEVMDDPRASGRLPRSAASHVPMLAP